MMIALSLAVNSGLTYAASKVVPPKPAFSCPPQTDWKLNGPEQDTWECFDTAGNQYGFSVRTNGAGTVFYSWTDRGQSSSTLGNGPSGLERALEFSDFVNAPSDGLTEPDSAFKLCNEYCETSDYRFPSNAKLGIPAVVTKLGRSACSVYCEKAYFPDRRSR